MNTTVSSRSTCALALIASFALNSSCFAEIPRFEQDLPHLTQSQEKILKNQAYADQPLTASLIQENNRQDALLEDITKAAEVAYTLQTNRPTLLQKNFFEQKKYLEITQQELAAHALQAGLNVDTQAADFAAQTFQMLSGDTLLARLTDPSTQRDSYHLTTKLINMGAAVYSVDSENLKQRLAKSKKATEYSQVYQEIEIIRENIHALQDFQIKLLQDLKKDKKKSVEEIFDRHLKTLAVMHSKLHHAIQGKTITSTDQIRTEINKVAAQLQQELKTKYLKQNQLYRQEVQQMLSGNVNTAADMDEIVHVFTRNDGEFSGYVGYSNKENRLYVCFAGSKSQKDWLYNLTGWNGGVQSDSGLLQDLVFHAGFVKHFNEAATDFVESMTDFFAHKGNLKDLEICGAGHSLGGALAEMFTAATNEIAKKQVKGIKTRISVVTAGAPNNIAKAAVGSYDDKFNGAGNVIHFANKYDPVPKLAFWRNNNAVARVQNGMDSLFFNHHKMFVWLNTNPHSSEAYSQAAPIAIQQRILDES